MHALSFYQCRQDVSSQSLKSFHFVLHFVDPIFLIENEHIQSNTMRQIAHNTCMSGRVLYVRNDIINMTFIKKKPHKYL